MLQLSEKTATDTSFYGLSQIYPVPYSLVKRQSDLRNLIAKKISRRKIIKSKAYKALPALLIFNRFLSVYNNCCNVIFSLHLHPLPSSNVDYLRGCVTEGPFAPASCNCDTKKLFCKCICVWMYDWQAEDPRKYNSLKMAKATT